MHPFYEAFRDELQKLAAQKPEVRAERFLRGEKKDWSKFEKGLKTRAFREAVALQTDDPKLQKYVAHYGAYVASKDVVAQVPSRSGKGKHTVKRLPDGRLGCGCKDWQYKHSHQGTDCDHVKALKVTGLSKVSSALMTVARGMGAMNRIESGETRAEINRGRWAKQAIKSWDKKQPLPEAPPHLFPHHPKGFKGIIHKTLEP